MLRGMVKSLGLALYQLHVRYRLKLFKTCRERPKREKYAPISVEDYVQQKYKDVFGRIRISSVYW